MIWTYRVFHDADGYCIRVVYHERDGSLIGYQSEPAVPTGRTAEELAQDIQWLKDAFELPILTTAELNAELAAHPPYPNRSNGKTKTLEQLLEELEQDESESDVSISHLEAIASDQTKKCQIFGNLALFISTPVPQTSPSTPDTPPDRPPRLLADRRPTGTHQKEYGKGWLNGRRLFDPLPIGNV